MLTIVLVLVKGAWVRQLHNSSAMRCHGFKGDALLISPSLPVAVRRVVPGAMTGSDLGLTPASCNTCESWLCILPGKYSGARPDAEGMGETAQRARESEAELAQPLIGFSTWESRS